MAKSEFIKASVHRYIMPGEIILHDDAKRSVTVYLDPSSGIFKTTLPAEAVLMLGLKDATLSSRDMLQLGREFDRVIEKYGNTLRSHAAKMVIVISYAVNKPGALPNSLGRRQLGGDFITSHVPNLGLAIEYEVLHQIGDHIYLLSIDDNGTVFGPPHHMYRVSDPSRKIVEWSQERENVLATICDNLSNLIDKFDSMFTGDVAQTLDNAIEQRLGLPQPMGAVTAEPSGPKSRHPKAAGTRHGDK